MKLDSSRTVAAVILAAGRSSRMGTPKQLLEIEGQTLLRRTVETVLTAMGNAHIVLGFEAARIQNSLRDLPILLILAPDWEEGLSASVKSAISHLEASEFNAILFVPCDLPLLSSAHLSAMAMAYQNSDAPLVVSKWDDVTGVPALFDRALWPEFETLEGDEGARKIIRRWEKQALTIPFAGGKFDLDTPQQVEAWLHHDRDARVEMPETDLEG